jgi:hypothetical protein
MSSYEGLESYIEDDSDAVKDAVTRGISAAYPDPFEWECIYGGHKEDTVNAIRAAVTPLIVSGDDGANELHG